MINVVVILKIYFIEWILVILNNIVLCVGFCLNFGFSLGKEVYDWLKVYNISVDLSGVVLMLIVGKLSEFYGVLFLLIEEFVLVYCMYFLFLDYFYIGFFLVG